jgi:hypothetical protein
MEQEVRARKAQGYPNDEIAIGIGIDEARVERCLLGEHVVRVVHSIMGQDVLYMFECLPGESLLQFHRKSGGTMCFDILPPKDQDSKTWAERIVKDLAGDKGMNAVVAPRWADVG